MSPARHTRFRRIVVICARVIVRAITSAPPDPYVAASNGIRLR